MADFNYHVQSKKYPGRGAIRHPCEGNHCLIRAKSQEKGPEELFNMSRRNEGVCNEHYIYFDVV